MAQMDVQIQGEDDIKFLAQHFEPLEKAVDFATEVMTIELDTAESIDEIKSVLNKAAYGKVKITCFIETEKHRVEILLPSSYAVNSDDISAIRQMAGVRNVASC